MCLRTLHDRVRTLGLGSTSEQHGGRGGSRDLFDDRSPDWAGTAVAEEVMALTAFETAGVPAAEIIGQSRETLAQQPAGGGDPSADRLPAVLRAYRGAGYAPPLPDHLAAAVAGAA